MPKFLLALRLFLLLILLLFAAHPALAQDFVGEFLTPPGPAKTTVRLIGTDSLEKKSTDNGTATSDQRVLVYIPFYEKETEVYGVNLKWDHLHIDSDKKLISGAGVPGHFFDAMIGGTYKRTLNEKESVAFNLSFGSASDEPFASGGSSTLSSTFSFIKAETPISKWIYFLNYSNNRSFANNIPLPGFAYVYTPSKEFIGVFGLPFAFVRKAFTEDISASFLFFLVTYKMELSYKIKGPVQAYVSMGNSSQSFFREDRVKDDERFFYVERRTLVGVKTPLSESITADFYTGTISNRSVYEQEKYSLKPDNQTSLDSRYLLGMTLSGKF